GEAAPSLSWRGRLRSLLRLVRKEMVRRAVRTLFLVGGVHASDLAFQLVDDLVDRRVHVLARFVCVVVLASGVEVHLYLVEGFLAAKRHLSVQRLSQKL